jgi:hypothetical protein
MVSPLGVVAMMNMPSDPTDRSARQIPASVPNPRGRISAETATRAEREPSTASEAEGTAGQIQGALSEPYNRPLVRCSVAHSHANAALARPAR